MIEILDSTDSTRLVKDGAEYKVERGPVADRWFPVMTFDNEPDARRSFGWLSDTVGKGDQLSAETLQYA